MLSHFGSLHWKPLGVWAAQKLLKCFTSMSGENECERKHDVVLVAARFIIYFPSSAR